MLQNMLNRMLKLRLHWLKVRLEMLFVDNLGVQFFLTLRSIIHQKNSSP